MAANQPTPNRNKISREAQKEGRIQDALAQAKAYLQTVPPNRESALKEMAKAEKAAVEPRHWGDLTKCWAQDFKDLDQASRCLDHTFELAKQDPRIALVEHRTKEVDDAGKVTRHIISHRMIPSPIYVASLLAIFLDAMNDPQAVKNCMQKAENIASNFQSSMRAYQQFDEATLQYFDQAESQICWLYLAQTWHQELRQRQPALRCAAQAEAIAAAISNIPQWVAVAKFWMRTMGEPAQARRCVAEAEKTLSDPTPQSYISLAEGVAVLGDPDLPVQYLDQAESLIEELSDWSLIKYTWEDLGYFDRAERADNIWEYLASKTTEEEYLANGRGYGRYTPGDGPY